MSSEMLRARTPDFLVKLFEMVSDPSNAGIVSWSADGLSFAVHDVTALEADVLGKLFKHNSMKSLHRQLNLYGFRKIGEPTSLIFEHASFVRGRDELLRDISRARTSNATVTVAKAAVLESEVNSLKRKRSQMESEIDTITAEHCDIQARLDCAEADAKALRDDLEASKRATALLNSQLDSLHMLLAGRGLVAGGVAALSVEPVTATAGDAPATSTAPGSRPWVDTSFARSGFFGPGSLSSDRPLKRAKGNDDDFAAFGLASAGSASNGFSARSVLGLTMDLHNF